MLKVVFIYLVMFDMFSDEVCCDVLCVCCFEDYVECFDEIVYWICVLLLGEQQCLVGVCVLLYKFDFLFFDEVISVFDVDNEVCFYYLFVEWLLKVVIVSIVYCELLVVFYVGMINVECVSSDDKVVV